MRYRVVITDGARKDLLRLHEFLLARELERDGGDLAFPDLAVGAILGALDILARHPYTCRKMGEHPSWRELVIAFGRTGYVAQFEIVSEDLVIVGAIRHQREDDYH